MGNTLSRWVALLALILASAACNSTVTPPPTPTSVGVPTVTSRFSTHTGSLVRATLPPTWTQTPPPLPSLTPSLAPVAPTDTSTPVPDVADLCASVTIAAPIPYGKLFAWESVLGLALGTPLTAVRASGKVDDTLVVRFLATNLLSGQNQGVEVPGGQVVALDFPLNKLPGPGLYTWKIAVYGDTIGERCAHTGLFLVAPPAPATATPTLGAAAAPETPEPGTPDVTPAATPIEETLLPVFDSSILTALAPPAAATTAP